LIALLLHKSGAWLAVTQLMRDAFTNAGRIIELLAM
jgi:hypothetical protein